MLVDLVQQSNFFGMTHQNVGEEFAELEDGQGALNRCRCAQHCTVTLGGGSSGAQEAIQVAAGMLGKIAAADDLLQTRRVDCQTLHHLAVRVLMGRGEFRAQLKFQRAQVLALLAVNDPLIDFGDRRHAAANKGQELLRGQRNRPFAGQAAGQGLKFGPRIGQAMDLLALPQLQTMFQIAQELVGVGQVLEVLAADVLLVVQLLQSEESAAGAQPRFAAAVDALETLHQKFNIANAAAIDLHIDAGMRHLFQETLAPMAADLLPGLERRLDGDKIQLRAIDIGLHRTGKLARQAHVSGGMAHLDHGLQLPIVGGVGVVVNGVGQRHRGLALAALRTQAQVNAKHRAFAGMPGQQLRGLLRQANKVFAVGNFRRRRFQAAVVEKQQVNVGAIVQLVSAQLAQRKHREARVNHAPVGIQPLWRAKAVLELRFRLAQRFLDEHVGQGGDLGCGLGQSCDAQHIAQHDADVLAPLEAGQQRGSVGFQRARAHAGEALLKLFARMGAIQVALAHEGVEEVGIVDQRLTQPGTVTKHHHRVVHQRRMFFKQVQQFRRGHFR